MKAVFQFCSSLLILVSMWCRFSEGCPAMCKCTRFKTFCRDSRIKSLPSGLPRTTQLLSMEGDSLTLLNSSVIGILGPMNLSSLQLVNMQIRTIEAITFNGMAHIESMTITRNSNIELKPRAFFGLNHLYYLDISDNNLQHLHSGVFLGLAQLRHLKAGGNKIRILDFGMLNGLRGNINCAMNATSRIIDFSRNWFSIVHKGAFRGLCSFTELRIGFSLSPLVLPANIFDGLDGLRRLKIQPNGWRRITSENTTMHGLYNLRDFHMENYYLAKLPNFFIADSKLLKRATITRGKIQELQFGSFQGLQSLIDLDLSENRIMHLNNYVFKDLVALRKLDLSENSLTMIEDNAFKGLQRLNFLYLTPNKLTSLKWNTFADLPLLRELVLSKQQINYIDPLTFSRLTSLKTLQLLHSPVHHSGDVKLETLHRLDSLQGPSHFSPKGLQVMKTLNLTGIRGEVHTNLGNWMRNIKYLSDQMHLEIYDNGVIESYPVSYFNISSLYLSYVIVLENNSLSAFPKLKSLTIRSKANLTIKKGAFNELYSLKYIKVHSYRGFTLEPGLFQGLPNLETLVIQGPNWGKAQGQILSADLLYGLDNIKEFKVFNLRLDNLQPASFLGLKNIHKLHLHACLISNISKGAFLGLDRIETLMLGPNSLSSIDPGVFGALCDENFTLTCENLTKLSKYCNTTFALKMLTNLDLNNNDITFIHPHAFLGCSQLRILILSWSKILALDFLYTPSLRTLTIQNGNVSQISNTSFSCTSKISVIDLLFTDVQIMPLAAFERLKQLEVFEFPRYPCDCNFQGIWMWSRSRRIQYNSARLCSGEHIDIYLSRLECNSTLREAVQPTNKTSSSNDYLYFKLYIEPVVLIFIFVGGCFGNVLLLLIIFRHSDMRNKNNACVVHLAIADLLSLILNLPLSYWDTVHVTWELGETTCKTFIMAKDLVVALVVFTVLALSFERFLVVYTSFKLRAASSFTVRPILFLGVVWVFAFVCSAHSYFAATVQTRCFSSQPGKQWYVRRTWTFQLLMFCLLPLTSILILNILTAYILKTSIEKAPGLLRNELRDRNRNIVANLVVILSVVFMLSYLPNFVLRTLVSWSVVMVEDVFWYAFLTYILFFFHTLFNPFALFTMGSKYKSHISNYVSCFIKDKQVPEPLNAKGALVSIGMLLQNLGERLIGNGHNCDAVRSTSVEIQDNAVKQARQERLKRLQSRFM